MIEVVLKSQFLTVRAIKKKTKTRFFQHLKVGDTLVIQYKMKPQSSASHGMYSIYFTCHRLDGKFPDEELTNNEILNVFPKFEFYDKFYLALRDERRTDPIDNLKE